MAAGDEDEESTQESQLSCTETQPVAESKA